MLLRSQEVSWTFLLTTIVLLTRLDFYVNMIPWLKYVPAWFPGASWRRNVHSWRAEKEEMLNKPYEWTKAQMVQYNLASHFTLF